MCLARHEGQFSVLLPYFPEKEKNGRQIGLFTEVPLNLEDSTAAATFLRRKSKTGDND